MRFIVNYFKGDVVLFPYPFTNLKTTKVRPAVIISNQNIKYSDIFIVPLISKTFNLPDELLEKVYKYVLGLVKQWEENNS